MNVFDYLQRLIYEAPMTVALGPVGSALVAGYAIMVNGELYLTPDGERYLAQLEAA